MIVSRCEILKMPCSKLHFFGLFITRVMHEYECKINTKQLRLVIIDRNVSFRSMIDDVVQFGYLENFQGHSLNMASSYRIRVAGLHTVTWVSRFYEEGQAPRMVVFLV